MRLLVWLVRAALFLVLFAFALNNLDDVTVRWGFGHEWRAPMVFIVLAAFAFGCAFGVFAMVPSWWRHRRLARSRDDEGERPVASPSGTAMLAETSLQHPPRDGL